VGDEGGTADRGQRHRRDERPPAQSVFTQKDVTAIDPDALDKQGERIYAGG
jgi:hypothetical protein